MNKQTKDKVTEIGRKVVRLVKNAVSRGAIRPERPDEKPDRKSIKKLTRCVCSVSMGWDARVRSTLKTKEQYDMLDEYVYQRLRRDGVLKALRNL